MRIPIPVRSANQLLTLTIILVVVAVAVFVGNLIGNTGLNYQDLVIIVTGLGLVAILLHRNGLEIGYLIWIALFALGYRTSEINVPISIDQLLNGGVPSPGYITTGLTPRLFVHPLVIIILCLFVLRLIRQAIQKRDGEGRYLPPLLWLFSLFWVWGWFQGLSNYIPWKSMFDELQNYLLIFPIFVVTNAVLATRKYWRLVLSSYFLTSTIIATVGILEYTVPGIQDVIPGLITPGATLASVQVDGFLRATFSAWGAPTAVFICLLAVPVVVPLWQYTHRKWVRVLLLVGTVLQLLGIYIAGYRSIWMTLGIVFIVLLLMRKGLRGVLIAACAFFILFQLVPETARDRLETGLSAVTGNFQDSSSLKRWNRASSTFEAALLAPLGLGWSAAGWAHSDVTQIFTNLGVVPGLIFIIWYLTTLFAAWQNVRARPDDWIAVALLGSFVGAGSLLLLEGVTILPQMALPVWFVWALTELRNRQRNPKSALPTVQSHAT